MKRAILIALIILIIFAGCKNNDPVTTPNGPELSISTLPEISGSQDINETVNSLEIFQRVGNPNQKYYNLMDWQDYIKDKFGIELYVYYKGSTTSKILYLNYDYQVPYSILNNSDIFTYNNREIAYDLTEYYEEYGWNTFIDQGYIDALTIDNQIFAVPAVSPKYIIPRYYSKDYLEALNMEVPVTVDEFYDYLNSAKSLNKNDPTFYPLCIQDRRALPSLSDVFRSYGVFVNSQLNTPFSYNPNTNTFENAVFSENFESSLNFIRTLQENNLLGIIGESFYFYDDSITKNPFIADIGSVNKQFASEYFSVYKAESYSFSTNINLLPSYEYERGYYLTKTNIKNVCEVRRDIAFYVFPTTLENIHEKVDLFNKVFTDSSIYADLRYGIIDKEYTLKREGIIPNMPEMGYYIDLKQIKQVYDPNVVVNAVGPKNVTGLNTDMFFEKNVFNQYFTYTPSFSSSLNNSSLTQLLFIPDLSPADAINEYKVRSKKEGIPELIEKLNEKYGTIPFYDYYN